MRLRSAVTGGLAVAGGALALFPLASLRPWTGDPTFGWSATAVLAALALLTATRPAWGLLTMAGLFPMAPPLSVLLGAPNLAEQMLLTFIGVAAIRLALTAPPDTGLPGSQIGSPLLLWGLLLVSSQTLWLSFVQQRASDVGPFLAGLGQFLAHGYFAPSPFDAVHDVAVWLEALAVAAVAERILRRHPDMAPSVGRMLIVAGGAFAAFSALRLSELALRDEAPLAAAARAMARLRFNSFYQDINAAGSLFAMFFVPAAWLAWRSRRVWAATAALFVGLAVWLAGSRAAFLGAAGGLGLAWFVDARPSKRAVLAVVTAIVLALVGVTAVSSRNLDAGRAALLRVEMTQVALRLTAQAPVFGVGLNRFQPLSSGQYSEHMRMRRIWRNGENAHNNFLQVLAELGVLGLAALLWSLVPTFRNVWRQIRAGVCRPETLGLAGGLTAFLLSALLGHPLLTEHVRSVFFLVLGITTALSAMPATAHSRRWRTSLVTTLLLGFVIVALPFRLAAQRRATDLTKVVYGAGASADTLDDVSYRRALDNSTWFVSAETRALRIPLRVTADSAVPCTVSVDIDRRAANTIAPTADRWTIVPFDLEAGHASGHTRRIDIHVETSDCRVLVGTFIER